MTQTQELLFDARLQPRKPPLARATDPATSHNAAAGVATDSLQARCLAVLVGQMTANEIAVAASQRFFGMADSYRKRMKELVRKELIVALSEPRPCRITGINATVYRRVG